MAIRSGGRSTAALVLVGFLSVVGGAARAQDCEVRIGMAGPLTGSASVWGLAEKAGSDFEAALANEAGGLQVGTRRCKVTVWPYDSQYTPSGGAAAANYFATLNIHAVNGPVTSPETTGYKPVAKRHGQVNFSSAIAVDVIGPEFPLAFHQLQSPPAWGPVLMKEAQARFKFKSAVVLGPNDQAGTDSAKTLVKVYSDLGVATREEYYQRGTINFAPLVTRIMMSPPDTVEFAAVPPGDVVTMVRQLFEAGYAGAIGRGGGTGNSDVLQGAGGIEKLKAFYWLDYAPYSSEQKEKFAVDYKRVMKADVPDLSQLYTGALATELMLKAIALAGTDQDGEKIAAELRKMTPESRYIGKGGWRGRAQYGVNQEIAFAIGLGIIADGKYEGTKAVRVPAGD